MKFLIHGINFSPELTGTGKYTGEMASWLADQGHEVRVITAPPYYPDWSLDKRFKNFYSKQEKKNITIIRCPLYIPKKPTTLKRFFHLISFSISSFVPMLGSIFWKPNVVIHIAPTLFCSLNSLLVSKSISAKSLIHIQDFEVDAMFGLSLLKENYLKKIALNLEKKIIDNFDLVSTISKGMLKKSLLKGISSEKLIFFPNWTEISAFKLKKKNPDLLKRFSIDPAKKIVLYSGNMGEKQGLEIIIKVANRLSVDKNIQFILAGEGVAKSELEKICNKLNLNNVKFLPLVSEEMFPDFLASADCHLVIQKESIGDAVLPSKLTNILAVGGNAIITASSGTALHALCEEYPGIALLIKPESISELESGITKILKMSTPNKVAQNYALASLDKNIILKTFYDDICSFINK